MNKFTLGQRVAVYENCSRLIGTVVHFEPKMVKVRIVNTDAYYWVHPRQCRRLKAKRPKIRIWVRTSGGAVSVSRDKLVQDVRLSEPIGYMLEDSEWTEFVAKRRKP